MRGFTAEQSLAKLGLLVVLLLRLVSMSGDGEGLGEGGLHELSGMPFCASGERRCSVQRVGLAVPTALPVYMCGHGAAALGHAQLPSSSRASGKLAALPAAAHLLLPVAAGDHFSLVLDCAAHIRLG